MGIVPELDSPYNSWEKEDREAMKQYIAKKRCLRECLGEIISSFTDQNIVCCQADPSFTLCEVCEKDVDHNVVVESGSSLFGRTYLALNAPKEARVQWEISLSRIGELEREIFKKDKIVCLQCVAKSQVKCVTVICL